MQAFCFNTTYYLIVHLLVAKQKFFYKIVTYIKTELSLLIVKALSQSVSRLQNLCDVFR